MTINVKFLIQQAKSILGYSGYTSISFNLISKRDCSIQITSLNLCTSTLKTFLYKQNVDQSVYNTILSGGINDRFTKSSQVHISQICEKCLSCVAQS